MADPALTYKQADALIRVLVVAAVAAAVPAIALGGITAGAVALLLGSFATVAWLVALVVWLVWG